MIDFFAEAKDLFEYTRELRRDFHRHPELGFQEVRTARIVSSELSKLGLNVRTGVADTGVVGQVEGARPGKVVLLRFDMDALPINEETGAEYASQNPGVMHACGHDGHVAIGLTVARLLHRHRQEFSGSVRLVFQPAEEGLGGAERMIAEGILDSPKPDVSLAAHLWNNMPLGWLGLTAGPMMAAADIFEMKVKGIGGHGAMPHQTADPILASAHIITAIQSIVSRNLSPLDSAVISVTLVRGGETFNVIPSVVELQGTIRTFEPSTRKLLLERFDQLVRGTAESFGCHADIKVQSITPAVINTPTVAQRIQRVASSIFPDAEISSDHRTMGSEDMAFMMQNIESCFIFIGSANSELGLDAAHHHPRFDFDEQALTYAVALMSAVTFDYLQ